MSGLPAAYDAERGSGTVLALALVSVLISVSMAAIVLGAAVWARQQAQTAADMAAVAAAQELALGRADSLACVRADRFVSDNGAVLRRCQVDTGSGTTGAEVVVEVSREMPSRLGWSARAVARAGLVSGAAA